jgi:hypothetical protein
LIRATRPAKPKSDERLLRCGERRLIGIPQTRWRCIINQTFQSRFSLSPFQKRDLKPWYSKHGWFYPIQLVKHNTRCRKSPDLERSSDRISNPSGKNQAGAEDSTPAYIILPGRYGPAVPGWIKQPYLAGGAGGAGGGRGGVPALGPVQQPWPMPMPISQLGAIFLASNRKAVIFSCIWSLRAFNSFCLAWMAV